MIIEHAPPPGLTDAAMALDCAIEALEARAAETDTASPEGALIRDSLETLQAIRAQRGCEHFDSAVTDGRLTTLIDVIVFG